MAKVSPASRGRTNIRLGRGESALIFTAKGVHNALTPESRKFINDMLTKGEEEAFKDIDERKFWTVVLPAVTYVQMAKYVRQVQQNNAEPASVEQDSSYEDSSTELVEEVEENEVPLDAFDG
tara:strand:+ start:73 stop:438 length:366 start_codon:yes stop_codon:yes gene_type:complete